MKNRWLIPVLGILVGCDEVIAVKSDGDQSSRPLVAAIEQARKSPKPVVIELDEGVYRLEKPLELTAADSQMMIRAKHRGKAVISGMRRLEDVRAAAGKLWTAKVPGTEEIPDWGGGFCRKRGDKCSYSFFQGGQRLTPARFPKTGFAKVNYPVDSTNGIFCFTSDRLAKWSDEKDLWAHGLWQHEWADLKSRILKVDAAKGEIQYDHGKGDFIDCSNKSKFYVFNARSEVSAPGDMYLDRERRELTFIPAVDGGVVEHAYMPQLITGKGMHDVRFEGIVFEGSRFHALRFENCDRVEVIGATIRHTSADGIEFKNAHDCRVVGCDLYDLGEAGIDMDGGNEFTLERGNNVIDNCHIHHYGQVFYNYKIGIQLRGCGNSATHNLIHHSDHSAIHFRGNDHYIGWNVMHDIMIHNHDAGTIYCCMRNWMKRGTIIEHNFMHTAGETDRSAFCVGIYLDDYSSGDIVRYNIVNRHQTGIYLGGGQDNLIYGNLLMSCEDGLALGSRGAETGGGRGPWALEDRKGRKSKYFKILDDNAATVTSELWRTRYPGLHRLYQTPPDECVQAHDARWNVFTNNVCAYAGMTDRLDNWKNVERWTTLERNLHLECDPGFVDYAGGNFEVREGSAAWRTIGGPTRFAEMGLYDSPDRASAAVKFGEDAAPILPYSRPSRPASIRIDIALFPPKGVDARQTPIVRDCVGCEVPWWSAARIVSGNGTASSDKWQEYAFWFTPEFDMEAEFDLMGARGSKTLYDGFEVKGCELKNPGFEQDGVWSKVDEKAIPALKKNFPTSDYSKPWGIYRGELYGVRPYEGEAMMIAHDPFWAKQRVKLQKGVRVEVRFHARACPNISDPAAVK